MSDRLNDAIAAVLAGLIGVGSLALVYDYFVPDTVRTTITDASMVKVDGRFMIATESKPFQNHDAWYRLKFNSGTIQNDAIMLRGKEVEIKKYGWRNQFFSLYENIVGITEIKRSIKGEVK